MASQLVSASAATTFLIIVSILIMRRRRPSPSPSIATSSSPETTILCKNLASALPDSVIFPHDTTAFGQSMNSYWAQQECEVVPACVVRPRDVQELSIATTILKREYDERRKQSGKDQPEGLFAVRGGGHSPIAGAASINGGVLIDLSLFKEVTPSEDGSSVVIGAGCKWMDVSKVLDERGLAVVGGRNSAVGVGGLTLGGGLSFFSPRFGLVCSNIISYELVLASGSVTTASASTNPDLWRALKGGSNNFGIVTGFTARSFHCTNIWSGFLYMPSFQAPKVLSAFHECVSRADIQDPSTKYDPYAAGPLTSFTYVQKIGIQLACVNLVYTKPPEKQQEWPTYWKNSPFANFWRFWSTCKTRTLTSATDELNALNLPGRRQGPFASITIINDPATIAAAHAAYLDAISSIRNSTVKDLVWTLILQPLLPDWIRKGDANPLGLQDCTDPLVIIGFTANWPEKRDDDFVHSTMRRVVERIENFAEANGTSHPFRYLNYCAEWQKPFEGYGAANCQFLSAVSREYDPDGLFQRGCVGGFKLDLADDGI